MEHRASQEVHLISCKTLYFPVFTKAKQGKVSEWSYFIASSAFIITVLTCILFCFNNEVCIVCYSVDVLIDELSLDAHYSLLVLREAMGVTEL